MSTAWATDSRIDAVALKSALIQELDNENRSISDATAHGLTRRIRTGQHSPDHIQPPEFVSIISPRAKRFFWKALAHCKSDWSYLLQAVVVVRVQEPPLLQVQTGELPMNNRCNDILEFRDVREQVGNRLRTGCGMKKYSTCLRVAART